MADQTAVPTQDAATFELAQIEPKIAKLQQQIKRRGKLAEEYEAEHEWASADAVLREQDELRVELAKLQDRRGWLRIVAAEDRAAVEQTARVEARAALARAKQTQLAEGWGASTWGAVADAQREVSKVEAAEQRERDAAAEAALAELSKELEYIASDYGVEIASVVGEMASTAVEARELAAQFVA